jgi:hypothetical protein
MDRHFLAPPPPLRGPYDADPHEAVNTTPLDEETRVQRLKEGIMATNVSAVAALYRDNFALLMSDFESLLHAEIYSPLDFADAMFRFYLENQDLFGGTVLPHLFLSSAVEGGKASLVGAALGYYCTDARAKVKFPKETQRVYAVKIAEYVYKSCAPSDKSETKGYEGNDEMVGFVPLVTTEDAKAMYEASRQFLIDFLDDYTFSTSWGEFRNRALFETFRNIWKWTVDIMEEGFTNPDCYAQALKRVSAKSHNPVYEYPYLRIDLPEDPLNDELNNFVNGGGNGMEVDDAANHDSGGDDYFNVVRRQADTQGNSDSDSNSDDSSGFSRYSDSLLSSDDEDGGEVVEAQFIDRCLVFQ